MIWDLIGYLAAAFVLLAFCMRDMLPLRVIAIFSNVAFIAYAWGMGLTPIFVLHVILLPVNCWRLRQILILPATDVRSVKPVTRLRMSDLSVLSLDDRR